MEKGKEDKAEGKEEKKDQTQIDTSSKDSQDNKKKEDLIYDLDSGEMLTKEEYNKR